jgi:D-3-phosphoglycerate dehydrogenase
MMAKYKVVVTDQVFPTVDVERELFAAIDAELTVLSGDIHAVLQSAADADALLNTYLPFDEAAISQLGRAKIIARYGIGVDNIDLQAAKARDIVVTNVPDYCVEEVATHALAMILSLIRKLPEADRRTRAGQWGVGELGPMGRISEMIVGLIGYGRIGRQLNAVLAQLGATILVHDPYLPENPPGVRRVPLDELLTSADVVSLHAPLTDETRGIINADALRAMKSSAILVNTSRGPLIVLDDLIAALGSGEIRAAGLDVFEQEPPDASQFRDIPNLLASPHIAFYSQSAIRESQTKAATQVINVLTGQALPDYQVNR